MNLTPAQRERKVDEAKLLVRRARRLLDAVHADYRDRPLLTDAERAEWRTVVDFIAPLDRLADSGLLDR